MIKLVVSDIDDTLVRPHSHEINPEILETISELRDRGILVAIASGRQYPSASYPFRSIKDKLIFITENGAHVRKQEKDLSITYMDRALAEELVEDIRSIPGLDLLVSVPGEGIIESSDPEYIHLLADLYRNNIRIAEDALSAEGIIKVAAHRKGGIRQIGEDILIPKWSKRLRSVMAGDDWVDFMDFSVDKGNAVKRLQEIYNISKEETMAFGDNGNDIGMLDRAGESYAVENADPDVKLHANNICGSWRENGVWQVLKMLV